LALIDWLMPKIDGLDLCRRIREQPALAGTYVILLTARDTQADINTGLAAGADDYVSKPFDRDELRLRLRAGLRIVELQTDLAARVRELEEALARVKTLQGILPICSYCKKIRSDANYWQQVEAYLVSQADVRFSHGICPDCYQTKVKPEMEKMLRDLPPYPPAP
jgi:DNA-binding response OmpR family regulator